MPPKKTINAPVNLVMISVASIFHPIQAVKVQKIVLAIILANI